MPTDEGDPGSSRPLVTLERRGSLPFSTLSVIIANYNQGQFLGAAIESALNLDWPDVEVVVVDDGSTDHSRKIIQSFGSRITAILQSNQTQRVARNHGFVASTGDAVVHLDADDVLHPRLAIEAAAVWSPRVSKVQVLMQRIDESGTPIEGFIPRLREAPTPADVRDWLQRTTAYPTPPGSGNVYAREFLNKIFPLDDECGPATDSYCLVAAPFFGDVVTIMKPLAFYRIHRDNSSNMLSAPDKFEHAIRRAQLRHAYRQRLVTPNDTVGVTQLFNSRELVQFRTSNLRLTGRASSIPGDGRRRLCCDIVRTAFVPGAESWWFRVQVVCWSGVTLISPPRLARWFIRWRYGVGRRE